MKKLIILSVVTVLFLSLLTRNVLGSASVPYIQNRQELQDIIREAESYVTTKTLEYSTVFNRSGIYATTKFINFDKDNHTVELLVKVRSKLPVIADDDHDSIIVEGDEVSHAKQVIKIPEPLFDQLKREQSCCGCTIS